MEAKSNQPPPQSETGRRLSKLPIDPARKHLCRDRPIPGSPDTANIPPAVWEGYFLIQLPDGYSRTFWIKRQPEYSQFAPGALIVLYLSNPIRLAEARDRDFTQFAFIKDDGKFSIWKRFQNDESSHRLRESISAFIANPHACSKAFSALSDRCNRCGNTIAHLENSERLKAGICPDCAGDQ